MDDVSVVDDFNGFQLTCPMRGTTSSFLAGNDTVNISTHVPHAGHDPHCRFELLIDCNFNSRAPCGARLQLVVHHDEKSTISTHVPHAGHDNTTCRLFLIIFQFQLTCPMRGTTLCGQAWCVDHHISTHVPHAGHDAGRDLWADLRHISTHVPHAGHDCICWVSSLLKFNIL